MKYNVAIPSLETTGIGGPISFLKNFREFSNKNGTKFSKNSKNIFFPIEHPIHDLKKRREMGGCIIQRLDGIYYPEKHGEMFVTLNENIKEIYRNYSSHIIFQSEYSKKQCFAMFGPVTKYSIIHNGANLEVFYPLQDKPKNKTTQFITTGNFRNLDMLEPVIKALDILSDSYQFELQILGPVVNDDLKKYLDREYIRYLGQSTSQLEIAGYLRTADAFIYSHLNPPCPNSVIEAISTGLPVIGFDSGSMSELCHFSKDLLADVETKIFQEYLDFDEKELAIVIKNYLDSPSYFNKIALENRSFFSIEKCVKSYFEIFSNAGLKRESFIDKIRRYING